MILVEIDKNDTCMLDSFVELFPSEINFVETKKFDGSIDVASALVAITATTAPLITKIVVELIRAKKHIKLVIDGCEVVGMSEKKAIEAIEKLIAINKDKNS